MKGLGFWQTLMHAVTRAYLTKLLEVGAAVGVSESDQQVLRRVLKILDELGNAP